MEAPARTNSASSKASLKGSGSITLLVKRGDGTVERNVDPNDTTRTGVTLSLRPLDGSGGNQWREVPSGQRVSFTGLQPGEYELSAAIPAEALTITVPSLPIVAELHMPNGFLIGALDDDDPLRVAGLLPGDVIIAVGGFELSLLVGGAPADPEVFEGLEQATSVTVRREGTRVDVDLGENLMSLSFRAQASLDGPREGYPWEQVYLVHD